MTYKIIRHYQREESRHLRRVVKSGLTLEQAQAHCQDPNTSSRTCTTAEGKRRAAERGPWFDGYNEE
jgi:hypothetical protein